MISIKDFSFRYGRNGKSVFNNFNLEFQPGHIYGLLGKNGVGKSTLLYSIMGQLAPCHGEVTYCDMPTKKRYAEVLAQCYMVTEEYELPKVSLKRYVELYSPFYPNFSNDDLERNLSLFDLTPDLHLDRLSMGEKKKVIMCFALACNTRLLIMDEPTNGLDIPSKSQFRKLIATGMTPDRTIIISTHQVADIENLLDHIVIINNSEVLVDADVEKICRALSFGENAPDAIYAQPWMGGSYTVSLNTDGDDSQLRLELLFNAALTHSAEIQNALK